CIDEPVHVHRARERPDDGRGRAVSRQSVEAASLARARAGASPVQSARGIAGVNDLLRRSLPSIAVMAMIVALWWIVVRTTESAIFPTPWQVVTGTVELIRNGTLWDHIGASLM